MKILQASDFGLDFCQSDKMYLVEDAIRDLVAGMIEA